MADVHVLYRFYSATGQLLYVGITMNPPARWKKHKESKDWWGEVVGITLETYPTRDDLQAAERRAIRVERPLHNIVHAKQKPDRLKSVPPLVAPDPPPPPPPAPSPEPMPFEFLFGSGTHRDTCYGYVSLETYQRHAEADSAKWAAIRECTLCDSVGYRNKSVCNHTAFTGSKWREARKRLLQSVEGGGN